MRVLLVGPDLEENLSVRYLSAALAEAGHTASVATFDSRADIERVRQAAHDADLIGLSICYQIRAPEFLELARALKRDRPERPIIAGGHYASCAAAELLSHHSELDLIVIHEGERTITELAGLDGLSALSASNLSKVRGIVYRGGGQPVTTAPREMTTDLDLLPWPDRSGPARLVSGVPSAYLMGSRGCVSNCDYCCISTLHRLVPGKRFRQRRPERIAQEMAALYYDRGVRQFIFHDDNFLVPSVERNLKRIEELDRAMRGHGLRHVGLVLKCRPADVDRQVFLRLREMGLLRVFLGIESGSSQGLASIGRRQSVEEEHRALGICEELDISTQYTIIVFHPEATAASMLADLSFVKRHLAHPLSFCRAEIYAGTPLERRMIEASRAQGDYLARTYQYSDPLVSQLWLSARRLLRERCFSQENLLGQVIRLDHLTAVFRHFYDGREVDALVREFLALELDANRDTVDLFEELITTSRDLPPDSVELARRIEAMSDREQASRESLTRRLCEIREALHALSYQKIGLPRASAASASATRLLQGGPRHAAAVLMALGVIGCGSSGSGSGSVGDAGGDHWKDDGGVVEAPPPPMDAGDDSWKDDGGVIEAPPPPMDAGDDGWVDDGGVIEAPPPPMDGGDGGT